MVKPRVVVVDDDEDNARLLEQVLAGAGFEVKLAQSVREARAALAPGGIDALVTDYSLGDGDAVELLTSLGASRPRVAVLVTGHDSRADRERFKAAGFDVHLIKPIDIDQLERALEPVLTAVAATPGSPKPPGQG